MSTKMNWSYTNSLKLEQRRPRDGEHGALFYVVESIFLLLRNSRNTKLLVRIYSFLLKWVQSSRVTHSSGVFTKWPSLAIPSVHGIRGPRERKPYQAVSTKVGEGQKVLFQRASPSAQVQFRWAVSKLFTNITFKMAEWKQGLFGCCGNCGNCEYFGPFLKSLRELTYFMENYYRLLREFLLPLCGLQGCWGFEQEWMSLRLHFLLFSLHPHFSLTWRSPRKIWHRGNDQNT